MHWRETKMCEWAQKMVACLEWLTYFREEITKKQAIWKDLELAKNEKYCDVKISRIEHLLWYYTMLTIAL